MVTRFLIKFGAGLLSIVGIKWFMEFLLNATTTDLKVISTVGILLIVIGFIYSLFEINEVDSHE